MRIVAGNLQRRIPEHIPFVFVLVFGSVHAELLQDVEFGGGDASAAGGDLKIRRTGPYPGRSKRRRAFSQRAQQRPAGRCGAQTARDSAALARPATTLQRNRGPPKRSRQKSASSPLRRSSARALQRRCRIERESTGWYAFSCLSPISLAVSRSLQVGGTRHADAQAYSPGQIKS